MIPERCRPALRDRIGTCGQAIICPDAGEAARFDEIDEAQIFHQFQAGDGTGIQISTGNGGNSGCQAAGLQQTALRVGSRVENSKAARTTAIRIVEAIVALSAGGEAASGMLGRSFLSVPVRFHLDEHISARVAAGIRRRQIDVTTAAEASLIGAPDAAHLKFALAAGRVLATHDGGFLRLHAKGVPHAGIVYCRQQTMAIGEMLRRLILIHDLLSPGEVAAKVEFL